MAKVSITVALVVVTLSGSLAQYKCSLKLEAEDGRGGLRQPRSKASGEIALALFEDEDNIHELSFTSTNNSCYLELLSVTYANDGDADRIEITVNKTLLANFTTYELHNDGHNWNAFRTEICFLIRLPVRDGYTELVIAAKGSENVRNRVEIDFLLLQLVCASELLPIECPIQTITERCPINKGGKDVGGSRTLAVLEILELCGVIVSVLGVISGYVMFGMNLFYKLRKKRKTKSTVKSLL